MNTEDLQDAELGLRHGLVEEAVNGPVAAVIPGDGHLQEVLTCVHG